MHHQEISIFHWKTFTIKLHRNRKHLGNTALNYTKTVKNLNTIRDAENMPTSR